MIEVDRDSVKFDDLARPDISSESQTLVYYHSIGDVHTSLVMTVG